jgi:hypothetical protein
VSAEDSAVQLFPLFAAKRLMFELQPFEGQAARIAGTHTERATGGREGVPANGYLIRMYEFPKGGGAMIEGRAGSALQCDAELLAKSIRHGLAANGIASPRVVPVPRAPGFASGVVVAKADADAFFTRMNEAGDNRLAHNFVNAVSEQLARAEAARANGRG